MICGGTSDQISKTIVADFLYQNIIEDHGKSATTHSSGGYGRWGVFILEDQSVNGSNGSLFVLEYAKDRLGPTEDAPTCTFYIYAPVLHWH